MSSWTTLFSHSIFSRLLNYLPGLVILVFGMIALYSAVSLIDTHDSLSRLYAYQAGSREAALEAQVISQESSLYWSVLAMGLASFILIILNGDKLRKLATVNRERLETLSLLESRMAAIEATDDGISIVDRDGNISYMNPSLIALHGISDDDLPLYIGQPWSRLYATGNDHALTESAINSLETDKAWKVEFPITRPDGTLVHIDLSFTVLPDGGMVGTARDITERQKSQNEKKQLEQQFYQAQKMDAIGRLAGGVAHDFNNVLAAINGYAEFLVEDLQKHSPEHGFAENILQAGKQARGVVDQILAFSRQKQSNKDTLDLMTPINETLSMLNATLPKTIELTTFFSSAHTHIDGNTTQISQVLMNLCVNAMDAIDGGEGGHGKILLETKNVLPKDTGLEQIIGDALLEPDDMPPITMENTNPTRTRLMLGHLARDREYICLTVRDSGAGISRAIMEHIMEPFFTTKPVNKGTGLGLATVHGVIISHQGAMVIDSTLGEGTSFDIYLPLALNEKNTQEKENGTKEPSSAYQDQGVVLLVEDQANVRDMLLEMLERLGFDAQSCDTGLEALAVLQDEPDYFDLVITDQNMPKMTGLELVEQVHVKAPHIPFILVSGYSEERLQSLMKEHPAIKATLRKPVLKEVLRQKIHEVLTESRAQKVA